MQAKSSTLPNQLDTLRLGEGGWDETIVCSRRPSYASGWSRLMQHLQQCDQRERERNCRGGSWERKKMLKVYERQLCMKRGCRVEEREAGRGGGRMRGRQCYVPGSYSRQTKIWSQKVGEGRKGMEGIGEVPGPWHCHKQQHRRHLRSLPWIFPTLLFLVFPTTRQFSLSYYCQHDVTSPTIHAPCFPSPFHSSLYYPPQTKTSRKHKITP